MPITTADFADKKAYQKALLSTLKASAKGNFLFYEGKYADGNKARLLVFGPNLSDLKKHLDAAKATLLDEGRIDPGPAFVAKRGKLDVKALEALGIAELAKIAGADEEKKAPSSSSSSSYDANTMVPSLNKPVRIVLADVIAYQKQVAALQHPALKAKLATDADKLIDALKKGEIKDFAKGFTALQQGISDAGKAPEIAKELARIAPVAASHPDQKAKDIYTRAKASYDQGDMLNTRALITNFTGKFGHAPYEVQAIDETQAMTDFVAKAGSLADAYDNAKKELERKIDKALSDKTKFATYVQEATVLKDFFAKSATLGLRQQVKAIEAEADPAKRKKMVEKAILAVQEYLTKATAAMQNNTTALSIDYFRMLRHLHAEIGKLHH